MFVIILFPLKPIGELQVEVGHGGVIDELFVRADGGAVEVVGDAQFGGEGEVIDEACASHEPVADAFAVEHGEGELIEGCPFVEVESWVIAVGVEIACTDIYFYIFELGA